MYVNPRPQPAVVAAWYGRDYFSGGSHQGGRGYSSYLGRGATRAALRDAVRRIALIEGHAAFSGARVLELGCATGEVGHAVAGRGARVAACDISGDCIALARRRYPEVGFLVSPVERLPFPDSTFDIVLAFELIEHLLRPSDFVAEVRRVLRPGGVVVLTTPNVGRGRSIGWSRWSGFGASLEHLYFFDSACLARLLLRYGVSVVGVYSRGTGEIYRTRHPRVRELLRRAGLLSLARRFFQAFRPAAVDAWRCSDDLHTLMVIARGS